MYAIRSYYGNNDDELPRPGGFRHHRVADFEKVGGVGEVLPRHYFEPGALVRPTPWFGTVAHVALSGVQTRFV